jgi:hypothetical protein
VWVRKMAMVVAGGDVHCFARLSIWEKSSGVRIVAAEARIEILFESGKREAWHTHVPCVG